MIPDDQPPLTRAHALTCADPHGGNDMAYVEWGDLENPEVLFCVHGLTRVGARTVDWLGTSMGDLIGMPLASGASATVK